MTLLIVAAALVLSFFLFPIQSLRWVGKKAKARASAWAGLFPKDEEKS